MGATITGEMTVNQVLQEYPATLPVFNQYRVDACCGGAATLAVAAAAAGTSLEELLAALEASAHPPA
jgi:iron-sulfur cluster repair protein YtfE (RIC family)